MEQPQANFWNPMKPDKSTRPTARELIEELLRQRGWTLGDLAKMAGYAERTLRRVMSGEVELSERMAKSLAAAGSQNLESICQMCGQNMEGGSEENPEGKDPRRYDETEIEAARLIEQPSMYGTSLERLIETFARELPTPVLGKIIATVTSAPNISTELQQTATLVVAEIMRKRAETQRTATAAKN